MTACGQQPAEDLAATLADAFGGPDPIVTGEYRLGDVRHITADSSRARRELNWTPQHAFGTAVAELIRTAWRFLARGRNSVAASG